jgi:hypothetical protein
MHHPMTNHNAAAFTALCGRNPLKGGLELLGNDRNDPPCLGSVLNASLPEIKGLPTFVALLHVMYNVVQLPGQIAGFLGSSHNPFQVSADPSAADFHLGELELPGEVSLARLDHRATLLQMLDRQLSRQDALASSTTEAGDENPLIASRDIVTPLTGIGQVTERIFKMNHGDRLLERQSLQAVGRYPSDLALNTIRAARF